MREDFGPQDPHIIHISFVLWFSCFLDCLEMTLGEPTESLSCMYQTNASLEKENSSQCHKFKSRKLFSN